MSFLGFMVVSIIWSIICILSFIFGYARGASFDITAWSEGYNDGYKACMEMKDYLSELYEEEYGLDV